MAEYLWQEFEQFGSQALLAAAGSVIAAYNLCEVAVLSLMDELSNNRELGKKAFALLGTASRLDYLKCAVRTWNMPGVTELVDEFALHFSICSENRNLVAHAIYSRDWEALPEIRHALIKAPKNKPHSEINFFPVDETSMLAIANDCAETYQFGMRIFSYILTLPGHTLEGMPLMRMPLPEKPARPSKMTPRRPINPSDDQSPLQP